MNNIEKLAERDHLIEIKEACDKAISLGLWKADATISDVINSCIELKTKALQSSEPVAISDEETLRISKSGYSVKVGWTDKRIVACAPNNQCTPQWLEDAQRLCDGWNNAHPPASVPVEDAKVRDLILELKCLGEVLAMEMTTIEGNPIAPVIDDAWQTIERLVATQSASVPLEKYNKLLGKVKKTVSVMHNESTSMPQIIGLLDEAIAEAEGK